MNAPRRVLLIDDNDDARELLGLGLEIKGHTIAMASGGRAGLERALEFQPEFVFLDLGMPEMDGFETAVALRRIAGLAPVKIVALSGWNDQATLARTSRAGFDHHLTKPAGFDQIDSVLAGDYLPLAPPPLR